MKLVVLGVVLAAALADHPRSADAFAACPAEAGWSPKGGDALPPHAHLVFWRDGTHGGDPDAKLLATIDGKAIAVTVTSLDAGTYKFVLVEINSDRPGKLEIGWHPGNARAGQTTDTVGYVIEPRVAYPKAATATTQRYHRKVAHSTVREVFDGLAITVNAPAILAHVKLRRDAKASWTELDLPIGDADGRTIRIGELGCKRNYTLTLLEQGVDIDVDLTLPDGKHTHVEGLTHVVLPKLKTPTSVNPGDAE